MNVSAESFAPLAVPTHVLCLWVPLREPIRDLAVDVHVLLQKSSEIYTNKNTCRTCVILKGLGNRMPVHLVHFPPLALSSRLYVHVILS